LDYSSAGLHTDVKNDDKTRFCRAKRNEITKALNLSTQCQRTVEMILTLIVHELYRIQQSVDNQIVSTARNSSRSNWLTISF